MKEVSLPVLFFKSEDGKLVYAECPALKIVTYGKNLKQAKDMFQEAFSLWLDIVHEQGNIHDVLKELGWKVTKTSIVPVEQTRRVPLCLVADKHINLSVPALG